MYLDISGSAFHLNLLGYPPHKKHRHDGAEFSPYDGSPIRTGFYQCTSHHWGSSNNSTDSVSLSTGNYATIHQPETSATVRRSSMIYMTRII